MVDHTKGSAGPRGEEGRVMEGSWVWIALPVGILGLIAAVWFLVIAPPGATPPRVTPAAPVTATPWPTVTPVVVVAPMPTLVPTGAPTVAATATPGVRTTTITVGARVEVYDTGGSQLRVRLAPGTTTETLKVVPDGTRFVVVGGPESAGGLIWWRVDDQAGLVGWAAGMFLRVVP